MIIFEHKMTPPYHLSKKKVGSYPYVSVIFSISLALSSIGIFGSLIIYSNELEKIVRDSVKIQIFLQQETTKKDRLNIRRKLMSSDYLASSEDAVVFISKESAAEQFIKETGEDFQQLLGENPMHDTYVIKIASEYHDQKKLASIKDSIEKMPKVFQVYYVKNLMTSINKNIASISFVLLSIAVILFLIVLLLINNALRLAIFSQRFLIRSMQLVGATNWFIKKPFLKRAVFHGFISGMLASLFLVGLIHFGTKKIEDLRLIQNNESIMFLCLFLLILGMFITFISATMTVSKYLKLSLDDLY